LEREKVMRLVSVIVLSYRSVETIVETLDSVANQTYDNIELLIADDCSPDNTLEVVDKWVKSYSGKLKKIKIVTSKQNTGIPGNINRALKQVQGDYIKIIAADDWMSEDAIAEYVRFCENNPGKVPISKVHLFGTYNNADIINIEKYCEKCYDFAIKPYNEQYHALLKQNMIVAPSASFYPSELVRKLGGYDENYRWFEDYPMNLKVMHAGVGFGLIDKELVWYRMSEGSITASRQKQLKKTEAKLFFKLRFWYLLQVGMLREAFGQFRYWVKICQ
jgi:alpha-1,3-rhamnosyltransferase